MVCKEDGRACKQLKFKEHGRACKEVKKVKTNGTSIIIFMK
jgi:hypothetical protein